MTLNEIKTLIASDESRTLELKKTTGELFHLTKAAIEWKTKNLL